MKRLTVLGEWIFMPGYFFMIPCAFVSKWQLDLAGRPTPVWEKLNLAGWNPSPFSVMADALEMAIGEAKIPDPSTITNKVTGRGNKDVHPGGPTPFKALAYA